MILSDSVLNDIKPGKGKQKYSECCEVVIMNRIYILIIVLHALHKICFICRSVYQTFSLQITQTSLSYKIFREEKMMWQLIL